MTRRLPRHDFNRTFRRGDHAIAALARTPIADLPLPPLADLLPPAPPPKPRPIVKLDLRNAPSSMEQLAEGWRAKGG